MKKVSLDSVLAVCGIVLAVVAFFPIRNYIMLLRYGEIGILMFLGVMLPWVLMLAGGGAVLLDRGWGRALSMAGSLLAAGVSAFARSLAIPNTIHLLLPLVLFAGWVAVLVLGPRPAAGEERDDELVAEDPPPRAEDAGAAEVETKAEPGQAAGESMAVQADADAMDDGAMLDVLRRLCRAYADNDVPEVERLEPPAASIGEVLHQRGGIQEMRRVFALLDNMRGSRTLDMHWGGIGDWRG